MKTTHTLAITVPNQARPARLTVDIDPSDYDGLETLMLAAIHASGIKRLPHAPSDWSEDFTYEDGEINVEHCLHVLLRAALPTLKDFTVTSIDTTL